MIEVNIARQESVKRMAAGVAPFHQASTMAAVVLFLLPALMVLLAALYLRSSSHANGSGAAAAAIAGGNLPPGYTGWRHLGEIFHFLRPFPAASLGGFMQHRISRFGKVFSTNMLGQPVVVVSDPEMIRFVLQNESRLFRPEFGTAVSRAIGATNMGVQIGDAHKYLRNIAVAFLGSGRLRSAFLRDAELLASATVSSWKSGSVVSIVDAAHRFTFNIVAKNVLGMAPGDLETERLKDDVDALGIGHVMLPLNFPGTSFWRSMQARERNLATIKRIIDERREKGKGRFGEDMLGWVMENTELTLEQMGDLLQGMLIAGAETTTKAISLAVYFLKGCPRAIEQLREEHHNAIELKEGEGLAWDDYKRLDFTNSVISETLRLGNIARYIVKKATDDFQFKGFNIPRGCRVVLNFAGVHLDPSIFEVPEQFDPWRWMVKPQSSNSSFLAFSGGARQCAGADLARLEIAAFLHQLLRFDWEVLGDDHPIASPPICFPKGLHVELRAAPASGGSSNGNSIL